MATARADVSDDGRGSPPPESVDARTARSTSATENCILTVGRKRMARRHRPSSDVGEPQLRRNLESDSVSIRAALESNAVEIAFFVSYQIADGEQTVSAAFKIVERVVGPGTA
jgi:hypothetical protein